MHRSVGKRQLDFWASTIANYEALELPGDLGAPPRAGGAVLETYPVASVPFAVDGAIWDAVSELCSRLGVMPYSVITTALFLFLTRASGRQEVCAMSSSQHRNRPGSERLLGNFATPYPLRIGFDDNATLERAVLHCDRTVLAHREHQGVAPVTAFAEWSEVTRYNLNYLIAPDNPVVSLGEARVERLWADPQHRSINDLAFYIRQGASSVRGPLVYNAQRFSPTLATEIAARLRDLVHTIATEPSKPVSALSGFERFGRNR